MVHENDWIADQHENEPKSWSSKTWPGNIPQFGINVWSIGDDIYYSGGSSSDQYVLNKTNLTWETKTWSGVSWLYGSNIWTDGEDYFYDYGEEGWHYVLDQNTSTWNYKMWSGFAPSNGAYVWTDGENTYYSQGSSQYVFDKDLTQWNVKTWNGLTSFDGNCVWTDGENIYYSKGSAQYVLDRATSTWTAKIWNGLTSFDGSEIWHCGDYIFYSVGNVLRFIQYILDRTTSTWHAKSWTNSGYLNGRHVWTDGENIYSSYNQNVQRVLNREIVSSVPYRSNFPEMIESVDLNDKWVSDGTTVPYRYDFPEMIESTNIENAWITHDEPDPATEGLRFLKLTYHLTVNWEGNGTNNITVSTDIPEAFKRSDHLWIYSGMSYRDVAMVINTEIPQCPYQCRMTFDSAGEDLLETLDFIAPKFYIYRTRNASRLAPFNPANIDSALYSESAKNTALVDDRTYLSTPYNYACEPRVTFNFGSGGSFPEGPGSTVVTIDIIFAFTADQDDRYADLLARYPDHITPFEYIKNAVPYRPAFPQLMESVDISDKWLISDDIPFRWNFPELIRSTANPVEPPSFFTFKGRSSAEFGSIEILPLCLKHEEKTDFINFITGTPYVLETSILRSKVITITLNLKDISPANIDRVNSWLIGTGKLVLSHDPHRYYIATCNNALTGQKLVNTLGKVAVQFNVMPYKYDLKEKESFEPVDLAEEMLHKTAAIYYKGSAPAESTFKITATGNIEIYNVQTEKTVEIKGLTEYCIIDIKARKVTDENDLNILDRTYGDIFDLMLAPGDNYFFISGSVTAIGVKKKTRWY